MLAPAIAKTNLKSYDVPLDDLQSVSAALAEIAASPAGPEMGAFFDVDGTLVAGFTATAHAGDHARPVARFLGIAHVLCNHFTVDDAGLLTGNIVRPIVWGPTKAAAVQNFCIDNAVLLDDSYFYADADADADGDEDAALMALVGHPRPVNPRPRLAAAAGQRGWPVLRLIGSRGRPRVRSMLRKGD
jgi:hypothetical protein